MFKVINKLILGKDTKRMDILAPAIARHALPGQFVVVVAEEEGARIPLAIVESDPAKGTITLIFQERDEAAALLGAVTIGRPLYSVLGPLGRPAEIPTMGVVLCVATGIGTASILPVCRALRKAGNKVIGVLGARTKRELLLEPQMRLACNRLFIATEDGSYEQRGMAVNIVERLLDKEDVKRVYAAGAAEMMQTIAQLTRLRHIPLRVRLNSPVFCGQGICGACRVKVDHHMLLACRHGPEFDGHKVDFAVYKLRNHEHSL